MSIANNISCLYCYNHDNYVIRGFVVEELPLLVHTRVLFVSVLAEDAIKAALQDYKLKNPEKVKASA